MSLSEVLFVSGFSHNLLSVSKFTFFLDCEVIFSCTHCIFLGPSHEDKYQEGKRICGVVCFRAISQFTFFSFSLRKPSWPLVLRMGHPSLAHVRCQVSSNCLISCHLYHICPLATQTCLFSLLVYLATAPFDLIHCDLRGGYATPLNRAHYFLTAIDDLGRPIWILIKFETQ